MPRVPSHITVPTNVALAVCEAVEEGDCDDVPVMVEVIDGVWDAVEDCVWDCVCVAVCVIDWVRLGVWVCEDVCVILGDCV